MHRSNSSIPLQPRRRKPMADTFGILLFSFWTAPSIGGSTTCGHCNVRVSSPFPLLSQSRTVNPALNNTELHVANEFSMLHPVQSKIIINHPCHYISKNDKIIPIRYTLPLRLVSYFSLHPLLFQNRPDSSTLQLRLFHHLSQARQRNVNILRSNPVMSHHPKTSWPACT